MGFKERLKEAREQKGYTQAQLAEMVGVTKSAIANYETGVSSAKEQVLIKLMEHLGVDANFLWQDEMKEHAKAKINPAENSGEYAGNTEPQTTSINLV